MAVINIQPTYQERHGVAYAGMIGSMVTYDAVTRSNETDTGMPFGVAVTRGADKVYGCKLGGVLADFLGVSIRDITVIPATLGGTVDVYPDNLGVGILTQGEIWVKTKEAVIAGGPVHFDGATGLFGDTGTEGPIPGAYWRDSAALGELARIKLGIAR